LRAANNDHDAFRCIDSRQLAQLQCARLVRNQRDQGDVGSNFGVLVNELEVKPLGRVSSSACALWCEETTSGLCSRLSLAVRCDMSGQSYREK
jgi:hypothetical protein